MKKNIKVLALMGIMVFVLSGCFGQKKPIINEATSTDTGVPDQTATVTPTSTVVTQNEKVVERFYPTITHIDKSDVNQDGKPQDPERGFVVTQELIVKLYLIDKYSPGVCYGMPGPVPEIDITTVIGNNQVLAKFLKEKYTLSTDLDIYNKIKQINGIMLDKVVGGKYKYTFMDGQCCTLTSYKGDVTVVGNAISDVVTDQQTKNNPC